VVELSFRGDMYRFIRNHKYLFRDSDRGTASHDCMSRFFACSAMDTICLLTRS